MSSKRGKQNKKSDYEDDDYRKRRDRNNQAVKKSRFKSKQKTQETQERITKLKKENDELESKVKAKSSELATLKELIVKSCGSEKIPDEDIQRLLQEDDNTEGIGRNEQ